MKTEDEVGEARSRMIYPLTPGIQFGRKRRISKRHKGEDVNFEIVSL
jgi:hypothetical protein